MSVESARKLAFVAHAGQEDRAGEAYLNHVSRVALSCESEDAQIAALLHDSIEDTELVTERMVRSMFGDEIADAVVTLTHDDGREYRSYIEDVAENDLATQVKLADLEDNLDLARLDDLSPEDLDRARKYGEAHRTLLRV